MEPVAHEHLYELPEPAAVVHGLVDYLTQQHSVQVSSDASDVTEGVVVGIELTKAAVVPGS